ncbi:hypothetical protein Mapa_000431 [Marchantia paleacea]|nr:hypothetical protein Mapa_000431 [Marchantia paleacea]
MQAENHHPLLVRILSVFDKHLPASDAGTPVSFPCRISPQLAILIGTSGMLLWPVG